MGYLVCQECKGYYKLQDGESPKDFTDKCACGGKLRYAVSIDVVGENTTFQSKQRNTKQNKKNKRKSKVKSPNSTRKLFKCPDCGHKSSKKAEKCTNCGRKFTYEDKHDGKQKDKFDIFMRIIAGIGVWVILSLFLNPIISFIIAVIILYFILKEDRL